MNSEPPILPPPPIHLPRQKKPMGFWVILGWCFLGGFIVPLILTAAVLVVREESKPHDAPAPAAPAKPSQIVTEAKQAPPEPRVTPEEKRRTANPERKGISGDG